MNNSSFGRPAIPENSGPRESSPKSQALLSQVRWLRLIAPALLLACGGGLIWLGVDLSQIRTWLASMGNWAPPLFVLLSTVLMSLLLPKTAVSLTAGALFGTALGSALMLVIAVAAAGLNYAIGHWWLHDSILQMLRGSQHDAREENRTWVHAVIDCAADARFGLHLLIRLSPVPTMLISYSMGAVGARLRPYLLAAAVAIIPQILWVHSGSIAALVHSPDTSTSRWISAIISITVAIWISIIVPREAMKRLREMDSNRVPAKTLASEE